MRGGRWAVVQEYREQQAAWEERAGGVRDLLMGGGPGTFEERMQRAEEAHGEFPDATAAIAAARELVAAGGPRTGEAAEFLIERTEGPFAMLGFETGLKDLNGDGPGEALARLRVAEEATWKALIAHIGPEWAIVQDFRAERDAFFERRREATGGNSSPISMDDMPSAVRAVAAARAILNAGGKHERVVEAAEFLVDFGSLAPPSGRHLAAARALVTHEPDYEDWPRVLGMLDMVRGFGGRGAAPESPVDVFFEDMASDAGNPILRAAAKYYSAAGLMRGANAPMSSEERAALRERARGLSAGVEDKTFGDPMRRDRGASSRTFTQAEADLIATIRHATVGGTLPEWTGRRMDGREEPLSAYRGSVLLLDFWATWCVPCIDALPELRQLVVDLPADRFALLSISVDEDLTTVIEFMTDEPMPWELARGRLQRARADAGCSRVSDLFAC